MTSDDLKILLQRVDESATGPATPPISVADIRRRASRRRSQRRGLGAVAVLLLLPSLWILQGRSAHRLAVNKQPDNPANPPAVAIAERTTQELDWDADVAQRTADAILLARRGALANAAARRTDPLWIISRQVDQAALMLVGDGDRSLRSGNSAEAALTYQRVQNLFPGTSGAAIAAEHLGQIHS